MKKIILALLLSTTLAHKTIEDDLGEVETVEIQDESGTIITDQDEALKDDSFDIKVP